MRLWSAACGEEVGRLRGHNDAINVVAFSADGHPIASFGNDRVVKLWAAGSGAMLSVMVGHTGPWLDPDWLPGIEWVARVSDTLAEAKTLWHAVATEEMEDVDDGYASFHFATSI